MPAADTQPAPADPTFIYTVDRSRFGSGEWDQEPDRVEFVTAAGLPALIVRNAMGALCGYVAVAPGHPCHGTSGDGLEVHGGITYQGECSGAVCHVPAPGDPDDVWWLGFDAAHWRDLVPAMDEAIGTGGVYRNVAYMRGECESLAAQLAAQAVA